MRDARDSENRHLLLPRATFYGCRIADLEVDAALDRLSVVGTDWANFGKMRAGPHIAPLLTTPTGGILMRKGRRWDRSSEIMSTSSDWQACYSARDWGI